MKTPGGSNPSYSARVFYTERKNSLDDDLSLTKRRVLQLKHFFAKMQQEWFRRQQRLSLGAVKPLRPRPLLKREAQLNGLQVFFLLMLASFFLIHSLQRCKCSFTCMRVLMPLLFRPNMQKCSLFRTVRFEFLIFGSSFLVLGATNCVKCSAPFKYVFLNCFVASDLTCRLIYK